jgi:hypothetical protein
MVIAGSVLAGVGSEVVGASGLSLNVGGNRAFVISCICGCEGEGAVEVFGTGLDDGAVAIAAGGRASISTEWGRLPDCIEASSGCGGLGGKVGMGVDIAVVDREAVPRRGRGF